MSFSSLSSHQGEMTRSNRDEWSSVKRIVDNPIWDNCKIVRNEEHMLKAGHQTALIKHPEMSKDEHMEWARENQYLVRHLINKRRNYCADRLAGVVIAALVGNMKGGRGSEEDDEDGDDEENEEEEDEGEAKGKRKAINKDYDPNNPKPAAISKAKWLPTPDMVYDVIMRDPDAWGYDEETGEFDPAKKKVMEEAFAFVWNDMMPTICGVKSWGVTKKCYHNMSTGADEPTEDNPNPRPYVSPASEAFLLWLVENHWDRWVLRAKFGISNPDLKKYKNKDGSFKKGLEKLEGEYTTPCGGRQPFGGITEEGQKRLDDLINEVKINRRDNADFLKLVEDPVREMVWARNGRKEIEENRKAGRKKKVVSAFAAAAPVDEEEIDYDDEEQW